MTQPSPSPCENIVTTPVHSLERVKSAITQRELRASRVALSSSPGPDGITPKSEVPTGIMLRIMNLLQLESNGRDFIDRLGR